jgi:hypothetical protein
MHTGVAEAHHAELGRLLEQPGLVEASADRLCGARQEREVGEADASLGQRRSALGQALELPAGTDAVGSCAAREVAVLLDPGDGAVVALLVVLVGLSELGRDLRELE